MYAYAYIEIYIYIWTQTLAHTYCFDTDRETDATKALLLQKLNDADLPAIYYSLIIV